MREKERVCVRERQSEAATERRLPCLLFVVRCLSESESESEGESEGGGESESASESESAASATPGSPPHPTQGYLAHKKQRPPMTLPQEYT